VEGWRCPFWAGWDPRYPDTHQAPAPSWQRRHALHCARGKVGRGGSAPFTNCTAREELGRSWHSEEDREQLLSLRYPEHRPAEAGLK
jgi:hypothetical protein